MNLWVAKDNFDTFLPNFSLWGTEIYYRRTLIAPHRANVENFLPILRSPYRVEQKVREFVKTEINRMLSQKVIETAQKEWATPILPVSKKKRITRLFRGFKNNERRYSYSILWIGKLIDYLGMKAMFSTLDANSGYWQVVLEETDWDKLAFTSHHGLYRFVQLLFG